MLHRIAICDTFYVFSNHDSVEILFMHVSESCVCHIPQYVCIVEFGLHTDKSSPCISCVIVSPLCLIAKITWYVNLY